MPLKIDENHENVEVRFSAMFEDGLETESSVKIKTKGKQNWFMLVFKYHLVKSTYK